MTRLFELLLEQRRALLLAIVAFAALGVSQGWKLPAGILPDVTFPRIKVIADSGERSGDEMLRSITRPLEASLRRIPGVLEMRSITSRGSTEINLDCRWGDDMDLTLQRVHAQIATMQASLPPGTTVDARLMNPTLFPVYAFSMVSSHRSLAELRDLAIMVLRPELSRLPGVAEVQVQGGRRPEARITLDPMALEARGLDASQVADAIKRSAELQSVGLLESNRELYLGLVDARPPNLDRLASIPIPVASGPPVPLGTLGKITLGEAPEFQRYAAQTGEAVLVGLLRQPSSSTVGLADEARRWFAEHPNTLPPDVKVQAFYDQSVLVSESVGSVWESLIVGGLLAVVIVSLFLRSLKLGLAATVVLPGSVGLTLLGLTLSHQSLNLMTLGGVAAAIGLVLDDAIVVVEHLSYHAAHHEQGGPATAMAEIFPSLVGSSLCTIAIFVPFMFLGGVTGAFFKVLALSMTLMLTFSLLLCVTVLPLFGRMRPPEERPPGRLARAFSGAIERAGGLGWFALIPALLLAIAIVPLRSTLGSGFLPEMDEGALIIDYVLPPGSSVTEGDRILGQVEREIAKTPDVAAWSRRMGDQLGFFITEPNTGDYVLLLAKKRDRDAEAIADDLRVRLEHTLPMVEIEFGQLIEDVIGDLTTNPQPIEIRVFGEDRGLCQQKAREVSEIIAGVRGVVDIKDGVVESGPNLAIIPGEGAARAGLTADQLVAGVTPAVAGLDAGQIVRGVRIWPARVVLPRLENAGTVQAMSELRVPVAPGHWAKLGDLATIKVEAGETEIMQDDQRTMVSVTARLNNRDLGSAMAEVQRRLRSALVLPRGMSLGYGGLWAEQQSSFRGLTSVLLGATIAVVIVLLISFRSWRQVFAVMLIVIAALAGVFAALHLGAVTFNIVSFVGAIMVVGIVGENAYFIVAAHQAGLASGLGLRDAAVHAAKRRARPVFMTTAAGIAALAPLVMGLSAGAALLKPLALAVIGGFFVSAPLLLFVLPALLTKSGTKGAVEAE